MFRRTPSVLGCISVFVCKWFLKFTSFFFTEISDLGTHEDSGYRGNENGYSRLSVVVTLCSFIGSSGVIPLTHAPETDARNRRQKLASETGAGFWSVCHQHRTVEDKRFCENHLKVDKRFCENHLKVFCNRGLPPPHDAALIGWLLLPVLAPSAQRRKVWLTPTTRVPCSNAAM